MNSGLGFSYRTKSLYLKLMGTDSKRTLTLKLHAHDACNSTLLKLTGYYTYHQVSYSKFLHVNYIAFMYFVWISEQRVTFVVYVINGLVFYNRSGECLQRGTDWVFKCNIQQLYALPTLYLCVLYLSQNKQRLVPLTS